MLLPRKIPKSVSISETLLRGKCRQSQMKTEPPQKTSLPSDLPSTWFKLLKSEKPL